MDNHNTTNINTTTISGKHHRGSHSVCSHHSIISIRRLHNSPVLSPRRSIRISQQHNRYSSSVRNSPVRSSANRILTPSDIQRIDSKPTIETQLLLSHSNDDIIVNNSSDDKSIITNTSSSKTSNIDPIVKQQTYDYTILLNTITYIIYYTLSISTLHGVHSVKYQHCC